VLEFDFANFDPPGSAFLPISRVRKLTAASISAIILWVNGIKFALCKFVYSLLSLFYSFWCYGEFASSGKVGHGCGDDCYRSDTSQRLQTLEVVKVLAWCLYQEERVVTWRAACVFCLTIRE